MGLRFRIYCLCVLGIVLLAVEDASSALPPQWTKKHHVHAVRSASTHGTLGVSNDDSSIVVWSAATGDTVRAFSALRGIYHQTWLSADNKSVLALVQKNGWSMVWLLWIDIGSGTITDSLDVAMPKQAQNGGSNGNVQSDITTERNLLAVSVMWTALNPPHGATTYYETTIVNLTTRAILEVLPSSRSGNPRFEANDTRIGFAVDTCWSPSGSYRYDGYNLVDYPSKQLSTPLTRGRWSVVRWGQHDAVMLGRRAGLGGITDLTCVVNLCKDEILDTISDRSMEYYRFWAAPDMRTCIAYSNDGDVVSWQLPDRSAENAPCLRSTLPDTVKSDSVYTFTSLWFPFTSASKYLLQDAPSAAPYTSLMLSWQRIGEAQLRFGRVDGGDTSWSPFQSLYVTKRENTTDAYTSLSTGADTVTHLHATSSNQVLVSTQGGKTLIMDNDLRCTRGFTSPNAVYASVWRGDSAITTLQKDVPFNGTGPSSSLNTHAIVQRVQLDDFTMHESDTVIVGEAWTSSMQYHPYFQWIDNQRKNEMLFAIAVNTQSLCLGYLCDTSDDSIRITKHQYLWLNFDPPKAAFLGATIGGAVNESGMYAVTLQRSVLISHGTTSRVVVVDRARDTAVATIDNNYSAFAMFINETTVLLDSTLLSVPSLTTIANHHFKGPFAHSSFPDHAIVWDTGWFYLMNAYGDLVDSTQGPKDRPTVFRALSADTIISGHGDGSVRMYRGKGLVANTPQVRGVAQMQLDIYPQPAQDAMRIVPAQPLTEPITTFRLIDNTGRVVRRWDVPTASEYTVNIDAGLTAVPPGTYVLTLQCGQVIASAQVSVVR